MMLIFIDLGGQQYFMSCRLNGKKNLSAGSYDFLSELWSYVVYCETEGVMVKELLLLARSLV